VRCRAASRRPHSRRSLEVRDEVGEGSPDADGRELVRIADEDHALNVREVECFEDGDQVVHREHRALVDDDGLLLPVLVLAVELRPLARAVVPAKAVKELCDGHRLRVRGLAETNARLARGCKQQDAVLREHIGEHERAHDRRLARARAPDENAEPPRDKPLESVRLAPR